MGEMFSKEERMLASTLQVLDKRSDGKVSTIGSENEPSNFPDPPTLVISDCNETVCY